MTRAVLAVLAIACLLISACGQTTRPASDPTGFSRLRDPALESVRRIAVLPPAYSEGLGRSARTFAENLPAAMRELGRFEVIAATETEAVAVLGEGDPLAQAQIPIEALRLARERWHCDAILLTRVEQFSGYDPCSAGLQTALVDCRDGRILWAASAHLDSARVDVQRDIEDWYRGHVGTGREPVAGWRAVLQTPRLFTRYVSDRLAASVLIDPPQEPRLQPRLPPR